MTLGQWLGSWLGSWLGTQGEADPNAMYGSAGIRVTATGSLTNGAGTTPAWGAGTTTVRVIASGVLVSGGRTQLHEGGPDKQVVSRYAHEDTPYDHDFEAFLAASRAAAEARYAPAAPRDPPAPAAPSEPPAPPAAATTEVVAAGPAVAPVTIMVTSPALPPADTPLDPALLLVILDLMDD